MRLLLDKINGLQIGWNERPLGEADFYRLCRRSKVGVTEMPLRVSGFYYRVMGKDFIAIDSRLKGPRKLEVMFHELGHLLFHVPESGATANFHGVMRGTRQELEADAFALCAVIPRCWIEQRDADELVDSEGVTREMLAERIRILTMFDL